MDKHSPVTVGRMSVETPQDLRPLKYLLKSQADDFISLLGDEEKGKKKTVAVTQKRAKGWEHPVCVCAGVEGAVAAAGDCGLGSADWPIGAESAGSCSAFCSFLYRWLMGGGSLAAPAEGPKAVVSTSPHPPPL